MAASGPAAFAGNSDLAEAKALKHLAKARVEKAWSDRRLKQWDRVIARVSGTPARAVKTPDGDTQALGRLLTNEIMRWVSYLVPTLSPRTGRTNSNLRARNG